MDQCKINQVQYNSILHLEMVTVKSFVLLLKLDGCSIVNLPDGNKKKKLNRGRELLNEYVCNVLNGNELRTKFASRIRLMYIF